MNIITYTLYTVINVVFTYQIELLPYLNMNADKIYCKTAVTFANVYPSLKFKKRETILYLVPFNLVSYKKEVIILSETTKNRVFPK